jgi:hypothetical protein
MDGAQKARKARGTTTKKSRINAFPKYLIEFGDGALGQLHTSIYIPKCVMG